MVVIIVILACMLSNADSAAATQTNARLSLEVHAGTGFPTEDYLNTHVVSGFGISFPLKQRLFLSLDLGYWNGTVEENPDKFYDGRLKSFPVEHHSWIIQIGFKYFVKQRRIQDRTT